MTNTNSDRPVPRPDRDEEAEFDAMEGGREPQLSVQFDVPVVSLRQLVRALTEPLRARGCVADDFEDRVLAREQQYPTGLPVSPYGVAIPHTDADAVLSNAISVGFLQNPIEFHVMGGRDDETTAVRLVFLLALKESNKQLNLLAGISQMIRDKNLLIQIADGDEAFLADVVRTHLSTYLTAEK